MPRRFTSWVNAMVTYDPASRPMLLRTVSLSLFRLRSIRVRIWMVAMLQKCSIGLSKSSIDELCGRSTLAISISEAKYPSFSLVLGPSKKCSISVRLAREKCRWQHSGSPLSANFTQWQLILGCRWQPVDREIVRNVINRGIVECISIDGRKIESGENVGHGVDSECAALTRIDVVLLDEMPPR